MDEAPILMTPRSSTVEQTPYKRPIWVQLSAGQPASTYGSKTERLLFALPCIFLLTFYFISVII